MTRTRGSLLLLGGFLVACRSERLPAPVLTLLPAAFSGGVRRDGALCLAPGQSTEAPVWLRRAAVTFTIRGSADGDGSLAIALAGREVAVAATTPGALELTYQTEGRRGEQRLVFSRAQTGTGDVCFTQVALTQS